MLGSPALYEQIEAQLGELLGVEDVLLLLPTLTHIHAALIPVLADGGTVLVDSRAHKTVWDGAVLARSPRGGPATVRPRRPRGPGAAAGRAPARPPAGLPGRDQLDDRQPTPAGRVPGPGRALRRHPERRRRARLRGGRRAGPGRDQPVRPPRQRGRPAPRPGLRPVVLTGGFSKAYSSLPAFIACPKAEAAAQHQPPRPTCTRDRRRSPPWPAPCSGWR